MDLVQWTSSEQISAVEWGYDIMPRTFQPKAQCAKQFLFWPGEMVQKYAFKSEFMGTKLMVRSQHAPGKRVALSGTDP